MGKKKNKKKNKKNKSEKDFLEEELFEDRDGTFYFIAGYTSGGFPYGITWEQAEEEGLLDEDEKLERKMINEEIDNIEDLPF